MGLSGGSDSVALTLLLRDLAEHGEFTLAGCVHVNHGLRASAARDEAFCREFAVQSGLPVHVEHAAVRAHAENHGLSIEEAARKIRYSLLIRLAEDQGADRIAVGHTRDDQAETFLMKLMRGAGQTGLGGIYPRRGMVIRPLLDVARADLREWLTTGSRAWVEDETNADVENPRNRIRLKVLPELARALGGDPRPAIARAAAVLREDGEWLDVQADEAFAAVVEHRPHGLAIKVEMLARLPLPIEGRVLRKALQQIAGNREISHDQVEVVRGVVSGRSGDADIPGGRAELSGRLLVLLERGVP